MAVTALQTRWTEPTGPWGLGAGLGDGRFGLIDRGRCWRLANVATEDGGEIDVLVLISIGGGDGGLDLVQLAFFADKLGRNLSLLNVGDFVGEGALRDHLDAFCSRV